MSISEIYVTHNKKYSVRRNEHSKEIPSKVFKRHIYDNRNSLNSSLLELFQKMNISPCPVVFVGCSVMLTNQSFQNSYDNKGRNKERYYKCSDTNFNWENDLFTYSTNQNFFSPEQNFFTPPTIPISLKQQFETISSLPNFHKWQWQWDEKPTKLKHQQKFSISKLTPGSPRNRLLQALQKGYAKPKEDIVNVLLQCLGVQEQDENPTFKEELLVQAMEVYDIEESGSETDTAEEGTGDEEEEEGVPVMEIDEPNISDSMEYTFEDTLDGNSVDVCFDGQATIVESTVEIDNLEVEETTLRKKHAETFEQIQSQFETNLSRYEYYCFNLFSSRGFLAWRVLAGNRHVAVMNNCDSKGDFKAFDFVHVSATFCSDDYIDVECACRMFSSPILESTLIEQSSCCHTELLKDIQNRHSLKFSNQEKIESAKQMHTDKVIKLPSKEGVDRFSVAGAVSAEIVTLFNISRTNRTIAKCHASLCRINKSSIRSFSNLFDPSSCDHLKEFAKFYKEQIRMDFEEGGGEEENFDDVEFELEMAMSFLPNEKWQDVFNESTGMWTFHRNTWSKKKVCNDRHSKKFKADLGKRKSDNPQEFVPEIPVDMCMCGAGWVSISQPNGVIEFSHDVDVFSMYERKKCKVYVRKCCGGTCKESWDGAEDSVFCLTKFTAAGYEIGWEFVNLVMSMKATFSNFVKNINFRYELNDSDGLFMANPTFIKWFFAWASAMEIDFREPCFGCKEDLKVIACDGTNVGIGFKHTFVEPIEKPNTQEEEVPNRLRRFDRCFLRKLPTEILQKDSNGTVRNIKTEKMSKETKKKILRTGREELLKIAKDICTQKFILSNTAIIESLLPKEAHPAFKQMVSGLDKSYASVFKLLALDYSLDTLIPLGACEELAAIIMEISFVGRSKMVAKLIRRLSMVNTDFKNLVLATNASPDVLDLLFFCVASVQEIHSYDVEEVPPQIIEGTYNPAKYGRYYSFTQHGCEVRRLRPFDIDREKNKNWDNRPDTECGKVFVPVSKTGNSFLFLWFCPIHGHCLGFHIIPCSEGRKDPSASILRYAPQAPEIVLYDFACSLSEYTKNRESGFLKTPASFMTSFTDTATSARLAFVAKPFPNSNASIPRFANNSIAFSSASKRLED